MAWIGLLALLIAAMVTLSAMGAERNFRRSLEDWAVGSGGSPAAGLHPRLRPDRRQPLL